jgi:hypothetical protein
VRPEGIVGAVVSDDPATLNVATTEVLLDMVVTHVPVPEHPPPDQLANVEPPAATAVRVTDVPEFKAVELQVAPQLIPPTDDVTVPPPLPDLETVTVNVVGVVPPPPEYPGTSTPFT